MKYIRTKDGIFKVINKKEPWCIIFTEPKKVDVLVLNDKGEYETKQLLLRKSIGRKHWKEEIIAQANTIEELCDEFVVAYEDGARIVYSDLEWAKCKAKTSPIKSIIYGAIWTDKGLIYVAKMNEKGELELL